MPFPDRSGHLSRRALIASGATLALGVRAAHAALQPVEMQLGWIGGGNQLGEVVAMQKGFFADQGLELKIVPGGPNNDGIAGVASGRSAVGQVSSSPSLMLAVSQDLPVKCFAVSAQKHPYAFFSLPRAPVRTPADFRGKKVGIQATGVILLRALLKKNNIDQKDVQIVTIGADMSPLMTGQVDVVTGWLTNTTAIKVLGPDHITLRLWDTGVHLYANPYYTTPDTLAQRPDLLAKFLTASARGWAYAKGNPDEAVTLLVKTYPNLVAADEREAAGVMFDYCFDEQTAIGGYGIMQPAVWQDQIDLYAGLDQFTKRVPKVDEVMTMSVLDATASTRPKLG